MDRSCKEAHVVSECHTVHDKTQQNTISYATAHYIQVKLQG